MNHRARLDAIEQQVAPDERRCVECMDWPAHRVEWPEGHEYAIDPAPAQCESCGFEPVSVNVKFESRSVCT